MQTPIALICYNRPQHLAKVLAAMKDVPPGLIYAFCDGPKNKADIFNCSEVQLLVDRLPNVITRPRNIGLAASVTSAVDHVLARHDTVIVLEDDCVPRLGFFKFMEDCLRYFANFNRIMAVSGYTLPISDSYPYDAYFYPRIGSWGWATWAKSWRLREPNIARALEQCERAGIDINQGGKDVTGMVLSALSGQLDAWTPSWILSTYLLNGLCVYPVESYIDNIGFDGSGSNCGTTDTWISPPTNLVAEDFPTGFKIWPEVEQAFRGRYG